MEIKTIEWKNNVIRLVDQTLLPQKLQYISIRNVEELREAIVKMKVRGAPALGAAAALGIYLGIKDSRAAKFSQFRKELEAIRKYIASSRPTARNLFWGLERQEQVALKNKTKPIPLIKKLLLKEAAAIIEEDRGACRRLGANGEKLIRNHDSILTLCNTGIFATVDYGTALGIVYSACKRGKKVKVFVCETRPMLQGARLTTWELKKKGFDVTLICDSMAATLMRQKKINKIIVGADRIAANGDTANKIGTYNLAVLSRYHKIPFYVAAPASTFDLSLASGRSILIEERPAKELTELFFKKPIAAKGIKVFNPAFDVTHHSLISAIITDKGIIRPPYIRNIRKTIID